MKYIVEGLNRLVDPEKHNSNLEDRIMEST